MLKSLASACLTAALLATAACGSDTAAQGGKPDVIASFYPLAWVTGQIGGQNVSVSTLTKPGTEPHDLELSPRQVAQISDSAFVVYLRELQPAVDDAVSRQAADKSLDAAAQVRTILFAGQSGGGGKASYDPHLWLDPVRLATVAKAVGDRLARIDPGHAADYRTGTSRLVGELTSLDGEFERGLASCTRKTIVTSHEAFGYLADRYGLRQVGITGIGPDGDPSPHRVAELTELVRKEGISTVFTETLVSPKTAQTLADEAGVRTAVLDPVEGVTAAGQDYLSVMRENLTVLRAALTCPER
ncbi:MAG: metal ABC transporter substrate-binding protein [Streptosporangiaceae bacterium]